MRSERGFFRSRRGRAGSGIRAVRLRATRRSALCVCPNDLLTLRTETPDWKALGWRSRRSSNVHLIARTTSCCVSAMTGLRQGRDDCFVAKYMGDGVLVYFGYPRASEDDVEHAVEAGLAMIDAVPKLATPPACRCRVRMGIATGNGRGWRSDRIGRSPGARHGWRDAEPRGTAARDRRAERGGDRGWHASADWRSVRAAGPWHARTQRHRREGASLGGDEAKHRWKAALRPCMPARLLPLDGRAGGSRDVAWATRRPSR